MARDIDSFTYHGSGGLEMRPFGTELKPFCPVCGSSDVHNVWKIPMATLDEPITVFGGYFNQIPVLRTPFMVFGFDLCENCESILLNPQYTRENINRSYKDSVSYVSKMTDDSEWGAYAERYRDMLTFATEPCNVLVDAACGLGQILYLARKDSERSWSRLVGLDLSEAYVRKMGEDGIEAHEFDIDVDEHTTVIDPGSVDFVSFFEAFEHVERPMGALAKLLALLRPGGRLYFSAQRYGADTDIAIRPGEPIYIGPKLIGLFEQLLPCTVIHVRETGSRYLITLERTEAPVTQEQLARGAQAAGPTRERQVSELAAPAATAAPAGELTRLRAENARLLGERANLKEALHLIASYSGK